MHTRYGRPEQVLDRAFDVLAGLGEVVRSPIIRSDPVGPSRRRYANAAALLECELAPDALLTRLKAIERDFGRRKLAPRWGARVLDLDIVLWSGGNWANRDLAVPHVAFRDRAFVLGPAAAVVPDWRDPVTGLAVRHLHSRLTRPRPLLRDPLWSGR
ncbi:2-amino-4-hydroxy-6-hydroxymethyldihydropteridine diphosphokinase [Qipengyuania sp. JC766]|uniref:2-amino-4-hydroxy-6- hydroxymethyldihydropteridine diphosphokinase n=1 Tax=Qipengyuania sp. JC766 TaxID=3232139 RepID=UPI00345AF293